MIADLPHHRYVWVDSTFVLKEPEPGLFLPAVWFGIVSLPGRMFGLNVLLESGALFRNVPPHGIAFSAHPEPVWTPQAAQRWDCYSSAIVTHAYAYLRHLRVKARTAAGCHDGEYLFTVLPMGDGFSADAGQSKEFSWIALENHRLSIQPTNELLFEEKSFTSNPEMVFPRNLKRQSQWYASE